MLRFQVFNQLKVVFCLGGQGLVFCLEGLLDFGKLSLQQPNLFRMPCTKVFGEASERLTTPLLPA